MATLRVTVCELDCESTPFEKEWAQLVAHVRHEASELVLLPEMPFSPWFAAVRDYASEAWQEAVAAHDRWVPRLAELSPAVVLGSRPVNRGDRRLNEAFVWHPDVGYRAAHLKSYLPNEEDFWEASWYHAGDADFTPCRAGDALVGFQICTELWHMEEARRYGGAGAHIIACPRGTPRSTLDKWLAGGRVNAVVSGAFSLSSNRATPPGVAPDMGGQGWIVGPESDVIALTSRERPFATASIDLTIAERAKHTYPRYAILSGR